MRSVFFSPPYPLHLFLFLFTDTLVLESSWFDFFSSLNSSSRRVNLIEMIKINAPVNVVVEGLKNPANFDTDVLSCACEFGTFSMVKAVLAHPHVDLNLRVGYSTLTPPLVMACSGGHFDVAVLLLQDPRADLPS